MYLNCLKTCSIGCERSRSNYRKLSVPYLKAMVWYHCFQLGMVIEFYWILAVLFDCNTSACLPGSDILTKAILFYLLKYLMKSPAEITEYIFYFKNARLPLQADVAFTSKRHPALFLTTSCWRNEWLIVYDEITRWNYAVFFPLQKRPVVNRSSPFTSRWSLCEWPSHFFWPELWQN